MHTRKIIFNQNGSALAITLLILVVAALLSSATMMHVQNTVKKAGTVRESSSLLNIAEAGKEHALSMMRAGELPVADQTISLLSNQPFSEGNYSVSCKANSDLTKAWLISTGTLGTRTKAIESVYDVDICEETDEEAFDYFILTGGTFKHENEGDLSLGSGGKAYIDSSAKFEGEFDLTGDFFSRVKLKFEECTVYGDVSAPEIEVDGGATITGTSSEETVAAIEIPTIDWTSYKEYAESRGEVITGDYTVSSIENIAPDGGIRWVTGNILFEASSGGTITGCLIAEGHIKIECQNNLTQTQVGDLPAFVSTGSYVKKEVKIASLGVEGLVYAATDVVLENNGHLNGSIICHGDCTIENNWSLGYVKSIPAVPGEEECKNRFTMVSWREL